MNASHPISHLQTLITSFAFLTTQPSRTSCLARTEADSRFHGLIHACIQINDDVDRCNQNFCRDEHDDDPFEVFTYNTISLAKTTPVSSILRIGALTMCMTQLIFQHRQQIRNDSDSFLQQCHSLVHLQITPHSLVYRLELRFRPHELGSIEDGSLEVDIDP